MKFVGKLKDFDEIRDIVDKLRGKKTVAFTNGCFDIIHAGHVSYLKKAKSMTDILIVGLNSDGSIKRIKGKERPINNQIDRALVLGSLESVDYVVIFNEDTPQKLIEAIRPDILIKGADWKGKEIAGSDFVKGYGGRCEFVEFLDNRSTTNIVQRIINEYCGNL